MQDITQDWFVQLALSGARRDQPGPRQIFHSLLTVEVLRGVTVSLTWEKLRQNRGFFISSPKVTFSRCLIKVCLFKGFV